MATTGGATAAGLKKHVQVFFGTLTKTVRKKDGTKDKSTRAYLASCTSAVQDALNLTLATAAQKDHVVGDRTYEISGAVHGKTIKVPDPTGKKTKKGYLKQYSIQVPGNATKKEIEAFLKGSRAESFSIVGGRKRTVSK